MINVVIIGIGYWGANLLRAFNDVEGANLVAVVEKKEGRLEYVRKRYPHVKCFSSIDQLDGIDFDAVAIATPVPTHAALAKRFLLDGKHAFIEKPMAHTTQAARELVEIAKEKNLRLAVGHVYQFSPAVQWIANALHDERLKHVYHIDSIRMNLGPPASDVDVVWDLAPHDLSIILYMLKSAGLSTTVTNVMVQKRKYQRTDLDDLAHVFIEFEGGVTAHVHVSWVTSNKVRLLHLSCDKATVVFDDMAPLEKVRFFNEAIDTRRNADDKNALELSYRPGDIFVPTLPRMEPLTAECKHFIECIQEGKEPLNGGAIGLEVVTLLEEISPITSK